MTIGEKIKARRKELGMTTEELGRLIGVQRSAVTKYEKDKVDLKSRPMQEIARALDISPAALLSDTDPEKDVLEALHQDPRLGLLFDRVRNMSDADKDKMLQIANVIRGEIYPDD